MSACTLSSKTDTHLYRFIVLHEFIGFTKKIVLVVD